MCEENVTMCWMVDTVQDKNLRKTKAHISILAGPSMNSPWYRGKGGTASLCSEQKGMKMTQLIQLIQTLQFEFSLFAALTSSWFGFRHGLLSVAAAPKEGWGEVEPYVLRSQGAKPVRREVRCACRRGGLSGRFGSVVPEKLKAAARVKAEKEKVEAGHQ